jgi:hypothetical protein
VSTLARARKLFADLSRSLDSKIDRLQAAQHNETDDGRIRELNDLIRQNQKALQTVLDQEVRLDRQADGQRRGERVIDLADARAEIARRLARLAG